MRTAKFHLRHWLLIAILAFLATGTLANDTFTMNKIGHVSKQGDTTTIAIKPEYQDGLLRLDDFSHV